MINTMDAISLRNSSELVAPLGHYSHVAVRAGVAHISGQLPVDAKGIPLVDKPFEAQVRQVLQNLDGCVIAGGSDRTKLLQVTVYVKDMAQWPAFDAGTIVASTPFDRSTTLSPCCNAIAEKDRSGIEHPVTASRIDDVRQHAELMRWQSSVFGDKSTYSVLSVIDPGARNLLSLQHPPKMSRRVHRRSPRRFRTCCDVSGRRQHRVCKLTTNL